MVLCPYIYCLSLAHHQRTLCRSDSSLREMLFYEYPETRRNDQVEDLHGVKVHDPFRWLEEPSSKETQVPPKLRYFHLCSVIYRCPK